MIMSLCIDALLTTFPCLFIMPKFKKKKKKSQFIWYVPTCSPIWLVGKSIVKRTFTSVRWFSMSDCLEKMSDDGFKRSSETVNQNQSSYLHFAQPGCQQEIITSYTWTTDRWTEVLFTKEIFVPKDKAGSNHVPIEDIFDIFDISDGLKIQFLSSVFSAGPTCGSMHHAYLVAEGVLFRLSRPNWLQY